MRSLLFVPGDSQRKLDKSLQSGADILLIDLEDSVAPDAKAAARSCAAQFMEDARAQAAPALFVRVNALDTGLTAGDLDAVMDARPAGIMLPKCGGQQDLATLDAMIRNCEQRFDVEPGSTPVIPLITETAAGLLNAGSYAAAAPARVAAMTWGAEDLSADLGARATRGDDGTYTDVFRLARATTLLAAAALGVAAIDTVYVDFRDSAGFERECREAERDGFTAKMAIHPAQVPIINAVFTPTPEAVREAEAVVAAFAQAGNAGVVAIDGRMFDRPHLRRAERLLARARSAGAGS